ncbi:MAG: DUF6520 family protein [Bacteroidia bacterium]
MKNLKKLLPVFAFVLGLGLVFTQSAFIGKSAEPTHYNTNPSPTGPPVWVELEEGMVIGTEEGEFSCDENSQRVCLASKSGEIYTTEALGILVEN